MNSGKYNAMGESHNIMLSERGQAHEEHILHDSIYIGNK
jgi:hypothetical protein